MERGVLAVHHLILRPRWACCFFVVCAAVLSAIHISDAQSPTHAERQPSPEQRTLEAPRPDPLSELQKLQFEIAGQRAAQETFKRYLEILAAVVTIASVIAVLLQVMGFIAESRSRRRSQEEYAGQAKREEQLHERFIKLLDITSKVAEEAQRKVDMLEGKGVHGAGERLRLINNLLAITERAAAKAAGAQFDFLSKSIDSCDDQCLRLITEAKADDDRDIIAKPQLRERVRVLTKQIESLDIQIINYNESVPRQFDGLREADSTGVSGESGLMYGWSRLSLTAPCLFVRGINHHLDQNFAAAIADWQSALKARGAMAIRVDANYWIGYVENTLGDFERVAPYLRDAISVATEERKVELTRLDLETRFFALDLGQVPDSLLKEGREFWDKLGAHRISPRARSSFATTMGNISLTKDIRAAIATKFDFWFPEEADYWFKTALAVEPRSRWARFGTCQALILAGKLLDESSRDAVRDVIGSVNREYQNRVEDRSKVLSKITEYIAMLMLGDPNPERLSAVAAAIESHTSDVTARTIYSQFRKQNVSKEVFLEEFRLLREERDLRKVFRKANMPRG